MMKPIQTISQTLVMSVALMATLISPVWAASESSIEVKVNGLVCAFCAQGITKAFEKEEATEAVFVSLERQLVAIALKPDMTMDDALVTNTLVDAGYDVVSIDRTNRPLSVIREGGMMTDGPTEMAHGEMDHGERSHHGDAAGGDHGHEAHHGDAHHGSAHHGDTGRP